MTSWGRPNSLAVKGSSDQAPKALSFPSTSKLNTLPYSTYLHTYH